MKIKLAVGVGLALAALAGAWVLLREEPYVPRPLPPLRPSGDFQATVMVPTLETPIPAGKSAVWCGAFQLAWNRFRTDVEKLQLRGAEALCAELNGSPFGEHDLSPESFYAAAGFAKDGILDRIRREMGERFPGVEPSLPPAEAIAYAFLAAGFRFKHAYREREEGVAFTDGAGQRRVLKGFGIASSDVLPYGDIYRQPLVLHYGENNFIVDLDSSSTPHQILLSMMARPASLKEAVEATEKLAAKPNYNQPFRGGENLAVPDVALGMLRRFGELEDKPFVNEPGRSLAVAQQAVQFRLDRGGAQLKAEAYLAEVAAPPRAKSPPQCLFDRPFLLLMKKRGAARPYLAVWVDNAEILDPR